MLATPMDGPDGEIGAGPVRRFKRYLLSIRWGLLSDPVLPGVDERSPFFCRDVVITDLDPSGSQPDPADGAIREVVGDLLETTLGIVETESPEQDGYDVPLAQQHLRFREGRYQLDDD